MTKQTSRQARASQAIQRELAIIIQQEVKDPRMPMVVTVTAVNISRDLSRAKVYITAYDEDADKQRAAVEILQQAASFIRSLLSQRLHMRITPNLHFVYDVSISYGATLAKKIDEAIEDDENRS